jgi:hypothetical protein
MKKRHTPQPASGTPDLAALPVTPPDVLSQACACCGAILPLPLNRLDAIPGQEHLRRAVTVALTGNHSITFLGSGGALADALAFGRISHHYGLTDYVTSPCICTTATPTSPAGVALKRLSPGSDGRRFGLRSLPTWSLKPPTRALSSA